MVIDFATRRTLARSDFNRGEEQYYPKRLGPEHPNMVPRVEGKGAELLVLLAEMVNEGRMTEEQARSKVAQLLG